MTAFRLGLTACLAMLFNPDVAPESTTLKPVEAAARAKGVTLRPVVLRRPEDLSSGLAIVRKERLNALLVFAVSMDEVKRIVEFCGKESTPSGLHLQRGCRCRGAAVHRPQS